MGHSGKRRTAIDLSMLLQLKLVPQIQNGIFRTHLELMERKVEVQKESAFPSELYGAVEQLIQGGESYSAEFSITNFLLLVSFTIISYFLIP